MDVMQAWQHGFRNVVAQMGTSLTETQLRLLQRLTKRFVLALDPDAAGAKATLRSLQLARETLDRDVEVTFDARGLVQLEGRLKADIRIVTLPEGQDPDNLIRADPTAWPKLLAEARPVVDYVIRVVAAELPPGDAKAKNAAAAQILPLIHDIAEPVERDHYLGVLSKTLGVEVAALRAAEARLKKQAGGRGSRGAGEPGRKNPPRPVGEGWGEGNSPLPPGSPAPPPAYWDDGPPDWEPTTSDQRPATATPGRSRIVTRDFRRPPRLEENFLRQCLEHPGTIHHVNHILSRQKQPEVSAADFERAEDRGLLAVVLERAQPHRPEVATIEELCDSLDVVLAERVRSLMALPPSPGMKLDRLPDTLAQSVLDWRLEKIRRRISELKQLLAAESQSESAGELARLYGDLLATSQPAMQGIHQAKDAMSAQGRRRAERAERDASRRAR
jgi:DNA primase